MVNAIINSFPFILDTENYPFRLEKINYKIFENNLA